MSTAKKKPPITHAKHRQQVNKKALIWIVAAFVVIVAAVGVMLVLNV